MMTLFHAGYSEIRKPDVFYGRKNADLGQGFYTTDDRDFACGWVREKKGSEIVINKYELETDLLKVKELERDSAWFEYVFANRRVKPDIYAEYDVIIGPVANDIIYDTFGIITSGFLSKEEALRLLMVGPCYRQIVLKTKNAAEHLKFVSSEVLTKETIDKFAQIHEAENKKFQAEFAKAMESLSE